MVARPYSQYVFGGELLLCEGFVSRRVGKIPIGWISTRPRGPISVSGALGRCPPGDTPLWWSLEGITGQGRGSPAPPERNQQGFGSILCPGTFALSSVIRAGVRVRDVHMTCHVGNILRHDGAPLRVVFLGHYRSGHF